MKIGTNPSDFFIKLLYKIYWRYQVAFIFYILYNIATGPVV